ncbi:hypothetical protein BDZ89DRAFT_1139888 [Hymenopellis radicata]|nr:hypothetical protein BDZ89DRAFT_1139888 [Hymenopellis radicata]
MNGTESDFALDSRDHHLESILHNFVPADPRLDPLLAAYYTNVTGFSRGDSKFHNITLASLVNETQPWTEAAMLIAFSASEKKEAKPVSEDMVHINGRLELTDETASIELKFDFQGVHFLANGSIYGLAEPYGLPIDIRLLPGLVPKEYMNQTAQFVEPELSARIKRLRDMIDAGIIEQDDAYYMSVGCLHASEPITHFVAAMEHLEGEMEHPTGAPTVSAPKLSMSGVLVSKECGFMLEVKHIEGLRSWSFFRKVTTYAGTASVAYFILLFLLTRQMEQSRTPAGIARVSRWLFFTQATIDSVSFAAHITFAIIAEGRPSISLTAPAFLACTMFVYEAQFAVLIHQVQMPEDILETPSPPPPAPPAALPPTPPPSANSQPTYDANADRYRLGNLNDETQRNPETTSSPSDAVATQPASTTPQPTPSPAADLPQSPTFWAFAAQHLRSDPGARLWLTMFIFLTFIVRVILSPTLSLIFVAVTYSGIWLPQIVRSVRRGRSSGFTKEYVIGTTACRLYLALYFLVCPNNVLDVKPRFWAYWLAAFVCFQGLLVMLQDIFGPTFFVPARFATVKLYDYHPILPLPDPEAPEQTLGDCSICMDAIQIDPSLVRGRKSIDEKVDTWDTRGGTSKRKGKGIHAGALLNAVQVGVGSAVTRKSYSLAPCHHLFHTDCLEKWLAIKNICPQCRRPLPPL